MEGTWGRHVYGWVLNNTTFGVTLFVLESELVAGTVYKVEYCILTRFLNESPDIYGRILDKLTYDLEGRLLDGMGRKEDSFRKRMD